MLPSLSEYDVTHELVIPGQCSVDFEGQIEIAKSIMFLLRLEVTPSATAVVFSNKPIPRSGDDRADSDESFIIPFEVLPRMFGVQSIEDEDPSYWVNWVKDHWKRTLEMYAQSSELAVAIDAFNGVQFVSNSALAMVSIWAALEALFSPSTSELRFRVSALIAAFLKPPGESRRELQRKTAKLYDKRSAAAHGKPKHNNDDLLASFALLGDVLHKIVEDGEIPRKERLEDALFGV